MANRMKQLLLLAAFLVGSGELWAETMPTLTFSPDQLQSSFSASNWDYNTFSATPLGQKLSLPSKTLYYRLQESESLAGVSVTVLSKSLLGQLNYIDIYADGTTSDDKNRYNNVVSAPAFTRMGKQVAQVDVATDSDAQDWARLLVFPVTIDDNRRLWLNETINITFNNHSLAATELLDADAFVNEHGLRFQSSDLSSANSAVLYRIITSGELAAAFQKLADYKNACGIQTEVVDIDAILASNNGSDSAEKLRNYLKSFYEQGGLFVLLGGDETVVPVRYAYHLTAYGAPPELDRLQLCDLYFADANGNWDVNQNGVWGEKYVDSADLTPELKVGRLPFTSIFEANNYIAKLITYETNPGNGDNAYLERAFFFASDEMRDFAGGGQHHAIASAFPNNFAIDTTQGVEQSSGGDLAPTNQSADSVENILSTGYGVVSIIAHGRPDAFGVRTTGYNDWPKSYFMSTADAFGHGDFSGLDTNGYTSFYASLACDVGGFDFDQTNPNLVRTALNQPKSGGVAFVANTRWGWVSSSYMLQQRLFEHLFAHPELPAIDAMNAMKDDYYYYRDQVYGINYFGDPTLKIYTERPGYMSIDYSFVNGELLLEASSAGIPVSGCRLVISKTGEYITEVVTDGDGEASLPMNLDLNETYTITGVKDGYVVKQLSFTPSIVTDVDDSGPGNLPNQFSLKQNYPNPFNGSTKLEFSLPARAHVRLSIYNILGQEVDNPIDAELPAGTHSFDWEASSPTRNELSSGIYLARLETDEKASLVKMLYLK